MPTLSDKLRALGVKVGSHDLPAPSRQRPLSLDSVLGGRFAHTSHGDTFLVEQFYSPGYRHGNFGLQTIAPLDTIAQWLNDPRLGGFAQSEFAYLDVETTGLSGGAGVFAFLIGAARFEDGTLHTAQFFMRDPAEEPAQLIALEEFLAPCKALVTFNGKAFDAPLLTTRYLSHGWQPPFKDMSHLDLLPLARRLWRERLPSRTLGNLEVQILGAVRTEEDIPGWMIPSLYFDYLHDQDPTPLKRVFYHNAMDVISMAALLNYIASTLDNPFRPEIEYGVDQLALGKFYEDLGAVEVAAKLYRQALARDLPEAALLDGLERLALLHKRQDDPDAAIAIWMQAARRQHVKAHVELAKYYEHQTRDISEALQWTRAAINLLTDLPISSFEKHQWLSELEHRKNRLERKLSGK